MRTKRKYLFSSKKSLKNHIFVFNLISILASKNIILISNNKSINNKRIRIFSDLKHSLLFIFIFILISCSFIIFLFFLFFFFLFLFNILFLLSSETQSCYLSYSSLFSHIQKYFFFFLFFFFFTNLWL